MAGSDATAVKPRIQFRLGPGLLVTAAFIGPGTVVTASRAGAQFGCELLWTILFASFGTIVLQSLAARLGILSGAGLGESIRQSLSQSRWLRPAIVLVIAAIGVGNAAYQTGNLTGAAAGITSVTHGDAVVWLVILIALTSGVIWLGRYKILHRVLVVWVILLSVSFLVAGAISMPPATQILRGVFLPRLNAENLTIVIALIGTTIVPYNLFLHASGAAVTWRGADPDQAMVQSDWDTGLSVALGGLVWQESGTDDPIRTGCQRIVIADCRLFSVRGCGQARTNDGRNRWAEAARSGCARRVRRRPVGDLARRRCVLVNGVAIKCAESEWKCNLRWCLAA